MQRTIHRRVAVFSILIGLIAFPAWAQEYAATLNAVNGGSGQCRAYLTLRELGKQLVYKLVCDNLSGDPTAVRFGGPTRTTSTQVIQVSDPPPVAGQTRLSEAEVGLLKAGQLVVDIGTKGHPDGEVSGAASAR